MRCGDVVFTTGVFASFDITETRDARLQEKPLA